MKSLAIIGAAAAIAAFTDAEYVKVQTTADGRKTHRPYVELGIDEDLCFFENLNDSWCFESTHPMIKVGMEWQQTYTTTPSDDLPVLEYY